MYNILSFLLIIFINFKAYGLEIQFVRGIVSKPETIHRLYYTNAELTGHKKIVYQIDPVNNERLGLYFSVQKILLGFAFDIIQNDIETSTIDLYGIYDFSKFLRLSFNYQELEGLISKVSVVGTNQTAKFFSPDLKSRKYEFLVNYQLDEDELFSVYVQNLPFKPFKKKLNISFNGLCLVRSLELKDPNSIIFKPEFVNNIENIESLKALSFVNLLGPLFGYSILPNMVVFLDLKGGFGYFYNQNQNNDLKETGFEFNFMQGLGIAWSDKNQKMNLNSKFILQNGRHIQTNHAELSFTYRFL